MNATPNTSLPGADAAPKTVADWRFALLGKLAEPGARRVFTAAEFHTFVQRLRPGSSASTARAVAELMVAAGALRPVSKGVFLNRRAMPPAELAEVAAHLRAGAVISLQSVLGECGFLNNPPDPNLVVAVVPTSATKRPRLGDTETSTGARFRFHGLAERFFPQDAEQRRQMLQPGRPCEMFRPEAALLQWLHLAAMQRSSMTEPPLDVDMDVLDRELLDGLAQQWGLAGALKRWLAKAQASDFGAEPQPGAAAPQAREPKDEQLERAAEAKRRMLERARQRQGAA